MNRIQIRQSLNREFSDAQIRKAIAALNLNTNDDYSYTDDEVKLIVMQLQQPQPKRPNPSAERSHQQRQQVSTLAETQLTQWVSAETSDYAASLTKLDQQLTRFEDNYAHHLVNRVESVPERILMKTVQLAAQRWGSRQQQQSSELEQSFAAAIDAVELPSIDNGFDDFLHLMQSSDPFGSKLLGSAG